MAFRHRATAALVLAVMATAIGVAVWFARDYPGRVVASGYAPPAGEATAAMTAATSPGRPDKTDDADSVEAIGATNAEPLPEGSIGDTYAALVRMANEGNGAAALRLANLLALCARYEPKSREAAEQELVDGMAVFDPPRTEDAAREQETMVALVIDMQDRQRSACPGFATLGIADPLAEQLHWTEQAARMGEARAIVDMADRLIKKYTAPGDIVEHAEELRLLRPQAMALLQQAAATGEPLALFRMATAHRNGDLAPIDAVEAYAWMLAYRAGPPSPDIPQAAIEHVMLRFAGPLDDAQRAEAQRRADAIRARCCGGG